MSSLPMRLAGLLLSCSSELLHGFPLALGSRETRNDTSKGVLQTCSDGEAALLRVAEYYPRHPEARKQPGYSAGFRDIFVLFTFDLIF